MNAPLKQIDQLDWLGDDSIKSPPIFSYTHSYNQKTIESYTIEEFDLNVLSQLDKTASIRRVANEVNQNGTDLDGWYAIPKVDAGLNITGYLLVDHNKKAQPITVGRGFMAVNTDKNAQFCIATSNFPLFLKLSQLGYVAAFDKDPLKAYKHINDCLPSNIPRLIASDKPLSVNDDLRVHFEVDVSQLSDSEIADRIKAKKAEVKPERSKVKLSITNMLDVEAQAINWLWAGWLPLGKITILAGAGGCGKTNLLLALIATISTSGIFPDGSQCTTTGRILIYSTEDDAGDTLKPRLMANGADLSKIDFIAGRVNEKGEKEPFDPTQDLPLLYEYAKQHPDIKLIMIDPIISAIGGDSNKATDVRRSLQVLVDFANEFNCSVVGITHFAKGTAGSTPSERIIGSQAFTALARMVWSAAKREDEGDCILVRAKSNISTLDGGVRYKLESEIVGNNIETTKTAWLGVIEGSARELLNDIESTDGGGSTLDMAVEFLTDLLSSVDRMASKEIQAQAKEAGFSPASIRRAQEKLNIKPKKPVGETAWFWSLPASYFDVPAVIPDSKFTPY